MPRRRRIPLTSWQRVEQASKAARARWARKAAEDKAASIEPSPEASAAPEQATRGTFARLAEVAQFRERARLPEREAARSEKPEISDATPAPVACASASLLSPSAPVPSPSAAAAAIDPPPSSERVPSRPVIVRPGDGTPPVACVHGCGKMLTPGSQPQHDLIAKCREPRAPARPASPAAHRPGRPTASQARPGKSGVRVRCFQCSTVVVAGNLTEADRHFTTSEPCREALGFTATAMRWVKP